MGKVFGTVVVVLVAVSGVAGTEAAIEEDVAAPSVEVTPDGVVVELRLKDGSRLFGRVESSSPEDVIFRTSSGGRLELAVDEIASLRPAPGRTGQGEFRPEDPNRTRLFFGPTARSLPRGGGYVGVYELIMPFVQVGLTDRITVGGGTPLVFGEGWDSHPFWFTPKVQLLRGERTQVAAGVMHFAFTGGDEPVGIAYGVVTHGTAEASITAGLGYGYESADRGAWIGMVGGDVRVGRHVKLLAEGYGLQDGNGILMGGVRVFGSRLSADLGLVTALGADDLFVFPVVNVVWTF